MSPLLLGRMARSLGQSLAPMRVTLRLAAAGWTAAACVWCAAVGSVGVLGRGLGALVALSVLGVIALAALFAVRSRARR